MYLFTWGFLTQEGIQSCEIYTTNRTGQNLENDQAGSCGNQSLNWWCRYHQISHVGHHIRYNGTLMINVNV